MAIKKITPPEAAPTEEPASTSPIQPVEAPPSPLKEIANLRRELDDLKRTHDVELTRERNSTERHRKDAEEAREELRIILESPIMKVLHEGDNLIEMEERFVELCEKCANAGTDVSGNHTIKIKVDSGRKGDGSVEFEITDKVTNPVEDKGACILWMKDGKLSESSAKQRSLLEVERGPRRKTAEQKLAEARGEEDSD